MLEKKEPKEDINAKLKKKKERGFLGIFKKKIFYDIHVRKAFSKHGYGQSTILENFHILKSKEIANKYVKNIYSYNIRTRTIKISSANNVDKEYGYLLHGPYEKKDMKGNTLESGFYFMGTKHETWRRYGKSRTVTIKDTIKEERQNLLSKIEYYKGWPKDATITYYDKERTKVKEVVPIVHGMKEGEYFFFFKNGFQAKHGYYEFDQKTKVWTEFYDKGKLTSHRKKEVQYTTDPFKPIKPYTLKEWNEKGELIFDHENKEKYLKSN